DRAQRQHGLQARILRRARRDQAHVPDALGAAAAGAQRTGIDASLGRHRRRMATASGAADEAGRHGYRFESPLLKAIALPTTTANDPQPSLPPTFRALSGARGVAGGKERETAQRGATSTPCRLSPALASPRPA